MAAQFDGDNSNELDTKSLFEKRAEQNPEIKKLKEFFDSKFDEIFSFESRKTYGQEAVSSLFEERPINLNAFFGALGEAEKSAFKALMGYDKEESLWSLFQERFNTQLKALLKPEVVDTQAVERLVLELIVQFESGVEEMRAVFKTNRDAIVTFIDQHMATNPNVLLAIAKAAATAEKNQIRREARQRIPVWDALDLKQSVEGFLENKSFHELPEWTTIREQLISLQQKAQGFIQSFDAIKAEVSNIQKSIEPEEMTDLKRLQEYRDQIRGVPKKVEEVEAQVKIATQELERIRPVLEKAQVAAQLREATQILDTLQPSWQEANTTMLTASTIWRVELKEMKDIQDRAAFETERQYIQTAFGYHSGSLNFLLDQSRRQIFASSPTGISNAQIKRNEIEDVLRNIDHRPIWQARNAFQALKKYQEDIIKYLNQSKECLARVQALKQALPVVGPKFAERVGILRPLNEIFYLNRDILINGRTSLEGFERDMSEAQRFAGDFKLDVEVQEIQAILANIRARVNRSWGYHVELSNQFRDHTNTARTRIEGAYQEANGDADRARQLADEALGTLRSQVSAQLVACEELGTYGKRYQQEIEAISPRVRAVNERLQELRSKRDSIIREVSDRELSALSSVSSESAGVIEQLESYFSQLYIEPLDTFVEDEKEVVEAAKGIFEPYRLAAEAIRTKFNRGSGYHDELAKKLEGKQERENLRERVESSVKQAFKNADFDVERTRQLVSQDMQALVLEIAQQQREHQELLVNLRQYLQDITDLTPRVESSRQEAEQQLREMRDRQKLVESTALDKANFSGLWTIFDIAKSTTKVLDDMDGMLRRFKRRLNVELEAFPLSIRQSIGSYEEAVQGIQTKFERALRYNAELMGTLISAPPAPPREDEGDEIDEIDNRSLLERTRDTIRSAFTNAEGDSAKAQQLINGALEALTAGARQQEGNYQGLLVSLQGYLGELEALAPKIDQVEEEMAAIERQQSEAIQAGLERAEKAVETLSSISQNSGFVAAIRVNSELSALERYNEVILASAESDVEASALQANLTSYQAEIKNIRERFTRSLGYHQELRGTILDGDESLQERTYVIIRDAFKNSEGDATKAQQLMDEAIAALTAKASQEEGNYQELLEALEGQAVAVEGIRKTLEAQYSSLDLKGKAEELARQERVRRSGPPLRAPQAIAVTDHKMTAEPDWVPSAMSPQSDFSPASPMPPRARERKRSADVNRQLIERAQSLINEFDEEVRKRQDIMGSSALERTDIFGPDAILGTIFGISKSTTETLDRLDGMLQDFTRRLSLAECFEQSDDDDYVNTRYSKLGTVPATIRKDLLAPFEEAVQSVRTRFERALRYNAQLMGTLLSSSPEGEESDSSLLGRTRDTINNALREARGDFTKAQQLIDGALEALPTRARQEEVNYRELLVSLEGYVKELEALEPRIEEACEQAEKAMKEIEKQQDELIKAGNNRVYEIVNTGASGDYSSTVDWSTYFSTQAVNQIEPELSRLERYSEVILASAGDSAQASELQTKLTPVQADIKSIREKFTRSSRYHHELRSTILEGDESLQKRTKMIIRDAFKNSEGDATKAQQLRDEAIAAFATKVSQEEGNYRELREALESQRDTVREITKNLEEQYPLLDLEARAGVLVKQAKAQAEAEEAAASRAPEGYDDGPVPVFELKERGDAKEGKEKADVSARGLIERAKSVIDHLSHDFDDDVSDEEAAGEEMAWSPPSPTMLNMARRHVPPTAYPIINLGEPRRKASISADM